MRGKRDKRCWWSRCGFALLREVANTAADISMV